ncbi:MAG: 30S ribosomal protein S12 methylthiotransferase RimO [Oscillospiraceae bacterium]|nr:30S ribosomal protein S12 methylthiotransferase RimO [Oscillospiraceae bacterium]
MCLIGMVSLGCSKNQVDAERMLFKIKEAGFKIAEDPALSDIVIVNTCGFIESAKTEAIETIFEFALLKKEGRIKKLVVTGCLSERYKKEAAELLPEADAVLGIGCNDEIVSVLKRVWEEERVCLFPENTKLSLEGGRVQTTLSFYSYLKIADGCSNCCSYCSIPLIRGEYRSVPIEALLKEAETLAENGVKELNIIAQDSTRYGIDLYGTYKLPELLHKLCGISGLKWIRLLYCYPELITDELLDVIAREEKIVKYIELPLQHCDGEILKNMNRPGDADSLRGIISKIRQAIPDVTLRTTFITGFPGETEEQFERLCNFTDEIKFERLGCFAYSAEEGTKAADLDGQLDEDEKQRRADIIMERQAIIMNKYNQRFIGSNIEVITEGFDRYGECYFGRSKADAPDIDGKVFFTSKKKLYPGEFVPVNITEVLDYDLIGAVLV